MGLFCTFDESVCPSVGSLCNPEICLNGFVFAISRKLPLPRFLVGREAAEAERSRVEAKQEVDRRDACEV
jgi:hypothetical protein